MNSRMFFSIKMLLDINEKAKKHKIGTYEIGKISWSCFDDKRFVLNDGINTLAYFDKDCNKKDCNDKKPVIIEKD